MTPIDRKIEIMNRVYASNVQKLTHEIIDLKMEIERMQESNDAHDQRRDDDA